MPRTRLFHLLASIVLLLGSTPACAAPVRLALFAFELEDESAGAGAPGETASDATGLADTTGAIRQMLVRTRI
jgi:hypothetical protein